MPLMLIDMIKGREIRNILDISLSDVMVNITTNTRADWSFGNGEAQFLNGKL